MHTDRTAFGSGRSGLGGGFGDAFLRRTLVMSVGLAVLGGILFAVRLDPRWGLSYFAAALWSSANFWALGRILAAVTAANRNPLEIASMLLVKVLVIYGLGLLGLLKGGFDLVAVAIGLGVPIFVIILKVLGRMLLPKLIGSQTRTASDTNDTTISTH